MKLSDTARSSARLRPLAISMAVATALLAGCGTVPRSVHSLPPTEYKALDAMADKMSSLCGPLEGESGTGTPTASITSTRPVPRPSPAGG